VTGSDRHFFGWPSLAAISALAALIAITVIVFAVPGASPSGQSPFCTLRRTPHLTGPHPHAAPTAGRCCPTLLALRRIAGDNRRCSAPRLGPGGGFQLYLNATPARRGALQDLAAFRLRLLRGLRRVFINSQPTRSSAAARVQFPRWHRIMASIDGLWSNPDRRAPLRRDRLPGPGRTSASVIIAPLRLPSWAQARPLSAPCSAPTRPLNTTGSVNDGTGRLQIKLIRRSTRAKVPNNEPTPLLPAPSAPLRRTAEGNSRAGPLGLRAAATDTEKLGLCGAPLPWPWIGYVHPPPVQEG